ncbi:hypothetical protein [Mycobacterium sp. 360MFTsu5.1]|uniref:hypothetical protein n=1 Tax=Mycobacterium sp. 360MFTsu5.1 TaxID=1172186 RepID=UPI00036D6EFF|nr:hypothetical protein [Mycobacterium sp. 360MFTsu5.1]
MAPQAVGNSADTAAAGDAAAAEAEAVQAEERARQARARAAELRRQATESVAAASPTTAAPPRQVSRWRPIAVGLAGLAFCILLGIGASLSWRHQLAQTQHQQQERAAAAARQGVINVMSLNFINAEDDVKRIADNATGKFKDDFQGQQYILVRQLIDAKVVTHVEVTGVAVQSVSENSAVVLVAATSQAANTKDPHPAPKRFRVVVTLTQDEGLLKIADLEYI